MKNKYDTLLKSLIPRFAQKGKTLWNFLKLCLNRFCAILAVYKQSSDALIKRRDEPIQTVDLSSDETETSGGAAGGSGSNHHFPLQYRTSAFEFKKPSAFVDISDDEDSDPFMSPAPASSTIIQNRKSEGGGSRSSSFRKNESTTSVVPDVKPVNSLAEKQQSRNCLKDDAIASIVRRFEEAQRKNNSQINDVSQT